jgi:hypothetical protein
MRCQPDPQPVTSEHFIPYVLKQGVLHDTLTTAPPSCNPHLRLFAAGPQADLGVRSVHMAQGARTGPASPDFHGPGTSQGVFELI